MRKVLFTLGGMSITLLLLFIAFLGPWYMINGSGILGTNYEMDFYLTRIEAKGTFSGQDLLLSMRYSEFQEIGQSLPVNTESFTMIETAMYLTLFALFCAFLSVISSAAVLFLKTSRKTAKLFGAGFGTLTFVLSIVPALYFMNVVFVEYSTEFWFNLTILGVRISGEPGYGWYLMIAAAGIALMSTAALLLEKTNAQQQ